MHKFISKINDVWINEYLGVGRPASERKQLQNQILIQGQLDFLRLKKWNMTILFLTL